MTKQEYIKLKWEEAGLVWDEIKFIVSPVTGGLQLQHPSLKTSLSGYQDAYDRGLLKGYDFDNNGLKVWNKLLDGFETNNGWTCIEIDLSNLQVGIFDFLLKEEYSTKPERTIDIIHVNKALIKNPDMAWPIYSHFRPTKQEVYPLFDKL